MEKVLSDFDKSELIGRNYIKQLYPKHNFDYSPLDEKASWDFSGQTQSGGFLGEIKIRGGYHDQHETAYLEVLKYEKLVELSEQNGNLPVFYYNVYLDKTTVYNISKLPISSYRVEIKMLPKTSAVGSPLVPKPVIHLPIKDAGKLLNGYQNLKRVI